jgi:hypothetical protein
MPNSQNAKATPILPQRPSTPWTAVTLKYWYRKRRSTINAELERLDQQAAPSPNPALEQQRATCVGELSRLTLNLYKKMNKVDSSIKKEKRCLEEMSLESRSCPNNQKRVEDLRREEEALQKCIEMYQRDS